MDIIHYFSSRWNTNKWNSIAKKMRICLELNQHCLICQQSSAFLICHYCETDIDYYKLINFQHNLLNNMSIRLGLTVSEFDQLIAISDYQWPLANLITQLKFNAKSTHARGLAQLFYDHGLPSVTKLPEAIIPIPLHKTRLAQRKYNQAAVIALEIAKMSQIPCLPDVLQRTRNTCAQTELSASERQKNTQGAFTLNKTLTDGLSHIALFDDVITTGATISSAAAALRSHYPKMQIDAWSICITPKREK